MVKKLGLLLVAVMPLCVSCYDDTYVWNELREHEVRISRLESQCQVMNANIASLQSILEALQRNEYLTNITEIEEDGTVIGYCLTFSGGKVVRIYHGKDGVDGTNGTDGADGKDGQDGYMPVIGVALDTDGVYYWTLDGEWLLDASGNKIPTTGKNGQDGSIGSDGVDGITPQLKIEEGYWYISYDNGATWERLGQATGDKGDKGDQGNPGVGGDAMFSDLDYSSSEDYVILYLDNGFQIKIPTWSAFDALKEQVEQTNANVEALQKIVEAVEKNVYVISVTPIYEGATEIGYIIDFSDGTKATIYHGKDGKDGYTPAIGVKQDTDGVYYWTLDGEWLRDDKGNKIPTTGKNGADGEDGTPGTPGKDGVTPEFEIRDGYWYVSYDEGETWEKLGKATGDSGTQGGIEVTGDSFFKRVDYSNEDYVIFELIDGEELVLQKYKPCAVEMSLSKVTGNTATFDGTIKKKSLDLKVTVYYATYANISVYKHVGSASMTEFPNDNFTFRVKGLVENTQYYYFTEVIYNGTKTYSEVQNFVTAKDKDSYIDWSEDDDNKIEDNV